MTRTIGDLPGPRRLPLFGNAHRLRASRLHLITEGWADRYGLVYRMDMGAVPVVVVSDRVFYASCGSFKILPPSTIRGLSRTTGSRRPSRNRHGQTRR